MKFFTRNLSGFFLVAALSLSINVGQAITLDQLRHVPKLTPEKFAAYFQDFEFKFHAEVQDHDVFLETKSGDCDDYATLAADILGRNGYTTRLIAVRMSGETHVVCYVNETKSYLDYNYRKDAVKTIPCKKSITEIARHVADSFSRDWIATYQFTFNATEGVKRLVQGIVTNRSTDKAS
ncbi:MAG: hypothetical protein ABIV39_07470 [Verrucomicrobiota bacterium]